MPLDAEKYKEVTDFLMKNARQLLNTEEYRQMCTALLPRIKTFLRQIFEREEADHLSELFMLRNSEDIKFGLLNMDDGDFKDYLLNWIEEVRPIK